MRNASLRSITLAASGVTQVAQPSKHRRVLTFSPNQAEGYTVAPDAAVADNGGLVITAGGGCVTLTFEAVGTLVQQAWFANNAAVSPIVVGVLESFELAER